MRVYVVGDVLRPGAYDVSSLSTPLNALYQAGGPTARGSLRILRHYRGPQLVGEIDLYDLLLHGVRSNLERLQPGDTIMVPPLGAELTVEGMVRRPAVYELNHESDLAEALQLAGGVLNTGTLRHIEVERVVAHESRSMLRLDLPENNNQEAVTSALEDFKIQDGDKIRISPILPYSEQTVYLDGHVVHPGKRAYREGMRITDLIHSYTDLLPEPAERHAEIIRLAPPDYAPQVIAFNLADALAGTGPGNNTSDPNAHPAQDVTLKAFDTVRIFSRFDFEDPPTITVSGEVRHPGEHLTNGETRLRDAVYLVGGVTPDALLTDAQVFRRTADGKLQVLGVNLAHALAGDVVDNIPLEPRDRVIIHRNMSKADPATVKIEGEVARPGKYPLGEDMSAAQLVRLAGGLKRGAFTEAADLTRYRAGIFGERVRQYSQDAKHLPRTSPLEIRPRRARLLCRAPHSRKACREAGRIRRRLRRPELHLVPSRRDHAGRAGGTGAPRFTRISIESHVVFHRRCASFLDHFAGAGSIHAQPQRDYGRRIARSEGAGRTDAHQPRTRRIASIWRTVARRLAG